MPDLTRQRWQLDRLQHVRWHVLDCEAITDIDVTGSQALDESLRSCHDRGVTVVAFRLRQDLATTLAHYGLLQRVEVYDSNEAAVAVAGP